LLIHIVKNTLLQTAFSAILLTGKDKQLQGLGNFFRGFCTIREIKCCYIYLVFRVFITP